MKRPRPRFVRSCSTLEALETRIVLATHIWIGPILGGLWNNGSNWNGGLPATGEPGGTIVQFNGTTATTDNIAGLIVDEIHFTAGGNTIFGSGGATLGINGATVSNNLVNDTGANLIDATLSLVSSGSTTFAAITSGKLTIASSISGNQGLTLASGTGTLTLTGAANTYSGDTAVSSGTLELGSAGTNSAIHGNLTIGNSSGAAGSAVVRLLATAQIPDTSTVQIHADGLLDLNGFDEATNAISLDTGTTAAASITTGAGTLALGGDLIVFQTGTGAFGAAISGKLDFGSSQKTITVPNGTAGSDLTIGAQITGTGGYIKTSPGTLEIKNSGPTGQVKVEGGTLRLNSNGSNDAIQGTLVVGTDTGTPATVRLVQSAEIADTSSVTVRTDGTFDLSGFSDTIGFFDLESGTAAASTVTAGTLTLTNALEVDVTGTGATGVTIPGMIDFGGHNISVGDGAAASDLIITGKIIGSSGYTVFGNGAIEVRNSGPTGPVTVTQGTLLLNSGGTNDAIQGDLNIGDPGVINSGTVRLLQALEIADTSKVTVAGYSTFDLNGHGDTIGSLVLYSGSQSGAQVTTGGAVLGVNGDVSLKTDFSAATPATITGGQLFLSSGTHTFDIADGKGATDLKITAAIVGAGAAITKTGKGTLEFANDPGDNTYTGNTTINDGVLLLTAPNSGDSTSGHIIIGDGTGAPGSAVLRLGQSNVVEDDAIITVNADGLLDFQGHTDTTGAVNVLAHGTIDLGAGHLTANGGLTVASGGVFAQNAVYNGANTDVGKVSVTGTVTLGGQLAQHFNVSVAVGTQEVIIDKDGSADPVVGTFSGLPEGAVFGTAAGLFKISYAGGDGNDVVLTLVDSSSILKIMPGGKSASYTDVDGDLVTVKTTKGVFTPNDFIFGGIDAGLINGYQLQYLNLGDAQFKGTAVTFTAKPSVLGGNGHVNVGTINSLGFDIASVTLPGDLSALQVGDNDAKVPGVGKLTVDSFGEFGALTERFFAGIYCDTDGAGSVIVKGDARTVDFRLGKVGSVAIGGSLIGDATNRGSISATSAQSISIGGSLIAPAGTTSGRIIVDGDLGSVTVTHDLIGSAEIISGGKLGKVAIKGAVLGESIANPALISGAGSATAPKTGPDTAIGSITIGQSVENLKILAGFDKSGAAFSADAAVGKISIGGDFRASSILVGAAPGADGLFGTADDTKQAVARDVATRFSTIAGILIKGQANGSAASGDMFAIEAEQIASAQIDGIVLKLHAGARSAADSFPLGFASSGSGNAPSDLYLREITA